MWFLGSRKTKNEHKEKLETALRIIQQTEDSEARNSQLINSLNILWCLFSDAFYFKPSVAITFDHQKDTSVIDRHGNPILNNPVRDKVVLNMTINVVKLNSSSMLILKMLRDTNPDLLHYIEDDREHGLPFHCDIIKYLSITIDLPTKNKKGPTFVETAETILRLYNLYDKHQWLLNGILDTRYSSRYRLSEEFNDITIS